MTIPSDEVLIPFSIQLRMPSRPDRIMTHRGGLVNHPANGWAVDREKPSAETLSTGMAADPARTEKSDAGLVLPQHSSKVEPSTSGET
jgi:hypothetical protein